MVHNSNTYRCDECGVHVGRKSDLARHMKLHASNKEDLYHRCPHESCQYKTLQRSNLNTHLRKHTGERPLKCPEKGCDFDTADPGSLTNHRKREHGYNPKSSRKNSSAGATRKTREAPRFIPYSTSLHASRGSSASTVSEKAGPSSNGHQFLPLQLPQPVDLCPSSSVLFSDEQVWEGVKNNSAAFETELALRFSRGNSSFLGISLDQPTASLSSTGSFIAPTVLSVDPALLSLLEEQNLYALNQPDQPVSQPTLELGSDAEFERFLIQYNEFMANSDSLHGATFQSDLSVVDNATLPTLLAPPTLKTIDDTPVAETLFFPSSNTQSHQYQYATIDNTSCENFDYHTQLMFFNAGYKPRSFAQAASSNMGVYPQTIAPQLVDQAYTNTAPMDPNAFSNFFTL